MKNKTYYIFWAAVTLIITVVMASSIVGLQVWLTNQENACVYELPTGGDIYNVYPKLNGL